MLCLLDLFFDVYEMYFQQMEEYLFLVLVQEKCEVDIIKVLRIFLFYILMNDLEKDVVVMFIKFVDVL